MTEYISSALAPKALKLEFKNRLENLCSLSGVPMSPDLRNWVAKKFGIEMVRIMESCPSVNGNIFSPQLQDKINTIVPRNYQGYNLQLGFNQLFDVQCAPPPVGNCLYVANVDFGEIPTALYFDPALTQPLFTNGLGDGGLRSLMQSKGGELYGIYTDGLFIYTGCHLFYYGTSADNIDVYTISGLLMTIEFTPLSSFAIPCENMICYTTTLGSSFTRLNIIEYVTPVVYLYLDVTINPPFGAYIDLDDMAQTTFFLQQLYGQSVNYTYVNNGNGTSTITIDKAIDWNNNGLGIYMEIFDGVAVTTGFVLNPC